MRRPVVLLALALPLLACAEPAGPPAAGMNLLLVTLDTTRADHVAPLGAPGVTPNLHRFAASAARFTRARSETNVTSPSHLTIMSGLPAISHGVMNNRTPVPPGVDTLAEALSRVGYATAACVAVRHLSAEMGWRGFARIDPVEGQLDAAEVNDCALERLDRLVPGPFFLWVHYFDPHALYVPPRPLARRFYRGDPAAGDGPRLVDRLAGYFERAGAEPVERWLGDARDPAWPRAMYAAEVADADGRIGELLAALEGRAAAARTVVVITADHGESLGENDLWFSHRGLSEPILHIPLLVRVPGWTSREVAAEVSTLDIAPTLQELMGVELANRRWGESLVPLLSGRAERLARRGPLVHQWAHNLAVAVRRDGWKLIWPISDHHPMVPRVPRLYDLRADPGETRDLAAEHPERVEELRAVAEPWIELGPVRPGDAVGLAPEALENLRALGYVDGG